MKFLENWNVFYNSKEQGIGKTHFYSHAQKIPKFRTHRFLSPIVGNVGIFETIEGVEELFDQTSGIAEIQESMGVCRIRRRMVGWNCVKRERENQHETQCSSKRGSIWILSCRFWEMFEFNKVKLNTFLSKIHHIQCEIENWKWLWKCHSKCGIQFLSETMTFLCLKGNINRRIQILVKGVGRSQIDLEHGNVKS